MATPLYLTEDDVQACLDMPSAIAAVQNAFVELADDEKYRIEGISPSSPLNLSRSRLSHPGGLMHVMAASLPKLGYLGLKAYTSFRGHPTRFVALLFRGGDGALVAVIEANLLGKIRTGAASGVASRRMAKADASVLAVYGAGSQALTQVQAVVAVRPIRKILVVGRTPERRDRFVETLRAHYPKIAVKAVPSEEALAQADIVTTITNAAEPVFDGTQLRPGTHINAAGCNVGTRRELDAVAVGRAEVVAVDAIPQARTESGDLIAAVREGTWSWERAVSLSTLLSGPFERPDEAITLFESQGIAALDVAAAAHVYEQAIARSLGRRLEA